MKKIILASSSPRRKDILLKFGLNLDIITSNVEETILPGESPEIAAMALAFEKAIDVATRVEDHHVILAADTIVCSQQILGKPKNEKEAIEMLMSLNGRDHYVMTGICILESGTHKKIVDYVKTRVRFRELSQEKIKRYIETGEYKDKAGAYGIQGFGGALVESIEGSYSNVVGLPISKVDFLLDEYFNITLL